ncbi:heterokaryon incompatibility protein-domain-containing protein [Truncatella angustata]|uniref:Heterokaryon incompatibility protein-domain-containing protein n=1 Tax=Truncatella angustata TaxID=152316 RepID=A0A9P9A3U1_9PEZI|nr:heterokaryon incompatibility protein-domain-containing protein [Truncatella angustata]KAH6660498.1 heterokaryon incompatibility protein-domain-containing protein [Truncatella angustata]
MACSQCQTTIFGNHKSWGSHDLSNSDCVFCSQLRADVEPVRKLVDESASKAPLYWWKLRRPARIRESPESYSLIFTPNSEGYLALRSVPKRTFHLLEQDTVRIATKLADRTDSDTTVSQMKSWLNLCKGSGHAQCPHPKRPTWIPKRLIDIGATSTDRILVIESATLSNPVDGYMTLSHCWGDPKVSPLNIRLTVVDNATFGNPELGIDWSELPQNFKDSITIARELKVRYIWIDALCIIQDNDEFHQEGQLMHLVYRNSLCTLAAASSDDSRGGLFRDRNNRELIPNVLETSASSKFGKRSWVILPSALWHDQLLSQPLYKRGWVFQERMLSPRILHFGSTQVFWDCASISACETLPDGLPAPLDVDAAFERHWRERLQISQDNKTLSGAADDSLEAFWKRAVRTYTASNLTRNIDRMPAVWSVAKLVRDELRRQYQKREDYGAGLWSSRLYEQLAWKVVNPSKASRPVDLSQYPTWTWASLMGEVELQDRFTDPNQFWGVTNHEGGEVSFELMEVPENLLKDVPHGGNDLQQELRTNALAIRGKLRSVALTKREKSEKSQQQNKVTPDADTFTLQVIGRLTTISLTYNNFEVFPDSHSPSLEDYKEAYLLILTASRIESSDSHAKNQNSSVAGRLSGVSSQTMQIPMIYGTGLILERVAWVPKKDEVNCHFQRIAACNFKGLTFSDFKRLNAQKGKKDNLWLL